MPVVPRLDVFHDHRPGGEVVREVVVVIHLGLEVGKEIFDDRIIPALTGQSHRLGDIVPGAPLLEIAGGILRATIGMENYAVASQPSVRPSYGHRVHDQRRTHV